MRTVNSNEAKTHLSRLVDILIAQAVVEGIHLLTADARVAAYPGPILRV